MRADSLDMLNTLAPKLLRLGVFFLVLTGVWTLSTFLGFRNVKFQITDFVFCSLSAFIAVSENAGAFCLRFHYFYIHVDQ